MNWKQISNSLWLFIYIIAVFSGQKLQAKAEELSAEYIIIGGGTAGLVLANKLSEKYSVIVLEAGTDQDVNPLIMTPSESGALSTRLNQLFFPLGHWVDGTENYSRIFPAMAGELLGGGSSVNGMQYVKSTPLFYQELEAVTGDSAWGPTNVYNVFKEIEKFNGISGQFDPAAHGFNGPINIRQAVFNQPAATSFATQLAAAATTAGIPLSVITDYNDPETPNGAFVHWQLSQYPDKTRQSSSRAYLRGVCTKQISSGVYEGQKGKLLVYTKAKAERILFSKSKKAKGVEAIVNGQQCIFQARKKIILSAGYQSPVLLQLSGIGDPTMLNTAGIQVVYANPNVGQNLLNHTLFFITGTGAVPPPQPDFDANDLYSGGAFFPDPTQPNSGRAFELIGIPGFPVTAPTYFSIAALLLNAKSKGNIGLNLAGGTPAGSDPSRISVFNFDYFNDPADLDSAAACYTVAYNTLIGMGLTPQSNFPNPTDSAAVKTYIRDFYSQAYHWVGACSMGQSPSAGAVVDSSGHVFGVKDLVVADISISPLNYGGNTQSLAYLIGNVIASKLLAE